MTQQNSPNQEDPCDQQGFPKPLIFMLSVLALGVLLLTLRVIGIL